MGSSRERASAGIGGWLIGVNLVNCIAVGIMMSNRYYEPVLPTIGITAVICIVAGIMCIAEPGGQERNGHAGVAYESESMRRKAAEERCRALYAELSSCKKSLEGYIETADKIEAEQKRRALEMRQTARQMVRDAIEEGMEDLDEAEAYAEGDVRGIKFRFRGKLKGNHEPIFEENNSSRSWED